MFLTVIGVVLWLAVFFFATRWYVREVQQERKFWKKLTLKYRIQYLLLQSIVYLLIIGILIGMMIAWIGR